MRKQWKACLAVGLLVLAVISGTYAIEKWDVGLDSGMTASSGGVKIQQVDNSVKFINESDSAVFVRMAFSENWESDKEVLSNKVGNKDVAEIIKSENFGSDWVYDNASGWFYYKTTLAKGDETANVISDVKLPKDDERNGQLSKYKDAKFNLNFHVETLQASVSEKTLNRDQVNKKALAQVWDKNYESINASAEKLTINW